MFSPILALLFGLSLIHTSMAIKCIAQPDHEETKNFDKQFPKRQWQDLVKYKPAFLRMLNTSGEVDCAEIAREYGLAEPTHCISTVDLSTCPGIVRSYAYFDGVLSKDLRGIKTKGCHFEEGTRIQLLSNLEWATANTCQTPERFGCRGCQVCNESDFCNAGTEEYELRRIEEKVNGTDELEMNTTVRMEEEKSTTISTNEENGTTEGKGTTAVTEKPEEKRIKIINKIESTEEENGTTIGTNEENGTTEGKSTTEVTEKPEMKNGAGLLNGGAPQALFMLLLAIATGAFRWAAFL